MNTKIIAAFAVFAMMFAGFGAAFFAQADDADGETPATAVATVTPVDVIVINIAGVVDNEDLIALITADPAWSLKYTVTLDDDIDEKITVITKDYYDAMKDVFGPFKGGVVVFTPADLINPAKSDAVEGLKLFTSLEMNKRGDIVGGVDTAIIYQANALPEGMTKPITLDFVFEEDVDAIVLLAVATAVAEVDEKYAGYLSPEEAQAAIDKAVAVVKDSYKDYKSPEEVKKACEKAVEDYIASHPVKKDDTYLYVTIVLAAVVLALVGFMVFDKVIKPKMAKKEEETKVI